ncbi:hypothetical protein AB0I68_07975 [Streptomyces sp. NPDC050448]|uniref:hypothetical protein n=1 Tax=Streptomyces sp. NPDC050448 TaxID=3155404 RepID=UPI00341752A7
MRGSRGTRWTAAGVTGAAIALPIPGQPFEPGDADAPERAVVAPVRGVGPPVPATPSRPVAAEQPPAAAQGEPEAVGS